jgi:hypothetical protein
VTEIDLNVPQGAIFSEDGKYRYALWRVWNMTRPLLLITGLNPSKADARRNDPTITRGMVRADRTGFGGLLMGNLYGLVSTDPDTLLDTTIDDSDVVGIETDDYLRQMIRLSARHLVGWGSFKAVPYRAPAVLKMIPEPYCLGVNADGQPKHPLYIGYHVPMVKYEVKL